MKVFPILLVSIGFFSLPSDLSDNAPNLVIERIIETGMIEGHDAKVIGGMGDPAAVILAKILADRDLRQQDVGGGLWILADAFAGDRCLSFDPDRKPRAAFLLLRYFNLSTADPKLREQIAEVRADIERKLFEPFRLIVGEKSRLRSKPPRKAKRKRMLAQEPNDAK